LPTSHSANTPRFRFSTKFPTAHRRNSPRLREPFSPTASSYSTVLVHLLGR